MEFLRNFPCDTWWAFFHCKVRIRFWCLGCPPPQAPCPPPRVPVPRPLSSKQGCGFCGLHPHYGVLPRQPQVRVGSTAELWSLSRLVLDGDRCGRSVSCSHTPAGGWPLRPLSPVPPRQAWRPEARVGQAGIPSQSVGLWHPCSVAMTPGWPGPGPAPSWPPGEPGDQSWRGELGGRPGTAHRLLPVPRTQPRPCSEWGLTRGCREKRWARA